MFFMVTEANYDKLRTVKGCEKLEDLEATITDREHMLTLADELGVPEQNRYICKSPTYEEFKATYEAVFKHTKKLSAQNKRHLLFAYFGGHGATKDEKQVFLLNASNKAKAMYEIEFKLRYISNCPGELT